MSKICVTFHQFASQKQNLRHTSLLHNSRFFAGWSHFGDAMTQMTQISPYILFAEKMEKEEKERKRGGCR